MMDMTVDIDACEFTFTKEVTKALLHTIFFNRLFGQISPKTYELLDLSLPLVDDAEIESLVEERATEYVGALRNTSAADPASLVLEFYEKKTRKAWFSRAEEEICWESWSIKIKVTPTSRTEAERKQNLATLERELEGAVQKILTLSNDRNDEYIPPIPYSEGNPFPYRVFVR